MLMWLIKLYSILYPPFFQYHSHSLSLSLSTNPASFCSFPLPIPPPLQIVLHLVAVLVYYTFDQSSCWTSSSKMSALIFNAPVGASGYVGLKANPWKLFPVNDSIGWAKKTVSNGSRTLCMKVWNPINNKKFETLSYLPPLSDDSIAKEIDYMLKKGWIPCLEFDEVGYVYRENSRMPGYYDGRYWTLWKLPMFGCTDPSLVLSEIQLCKTEYPNAYIRCVAFDNVNQGQCMAFIIQKPTATGAGAGAAADA